MSNRITRETLDTLIEEIIGVCNYDWMADESKPAEIEKILANNGIVVVEEQKPRTHRVWARVGRLYFLPDDEYEELIKAMDNNDEEVVKEILSKAKSRDEGDSYFPPHCEENPNGEDFDFLISNYENGC